MGGNASDEHFVSGVLLDINGGFVDDETAFVISENIETQKNTVQLRWWRRYQRVSSASASFEFHHSALLVSAERNNAKQSQKTDNEQDVKMNDFGDSVSFEIVRIFSFRYRLLVARHPRPRVWSVMGVCEPDSEIVRGTLGVVARSVPPTGLPVLIPCQPLSSSSVCSFNAGRRPSVSSRAREDVHQSCSDVEFLEGAS